MQADERHPGACRAEGLCLGKLKGMLSAAFFIVLISFLLSSIIYLLSASPLKSLPCVLGTYRVPEAHTEVVAARQPWDGAQYLPWDAVVPVPLGFWVWEPGGWALRLLLSPSATEWLCRG